MPIPDKVMFVYSSDTEKLKEIIIKQLKINDDEVININLQDEIRKFDYIKNKVLEELGKLKKINSMYIPIEN